MISLIEKTSSKCRNDEADEYFFFFNRVFLKFLDVTVNARGLFCSHSLSLSMPINFACILISFFFFFKVVVVDPMAMNVTES